MSFLVVGSGFFFVVFGGGAPGLIAVAVFVGVGLLAFYLNEIGS